MASSESQPPERNPVEHPTFIEQNNYAQGSPIIHTQDFSPYVLGNAGLHSNNMLNPGALSMNNLHSFDGPNLRSVVPLEALAVGPPSISLQATTQTAESTQHKLRELRLKARNEVLKTIHCFTSEENQHYLRAALNSPAVIESESDPLIFVRRCQYNTLLAAKRLCAYWRNRVGIFGPKASQPLAPSPQMRATLEYGFISILPNSLAGQRVFLMDPSRLPDDFDPNEFWQALFLINQWLLETDGVSSGVLGLVNLTNICHRVDFEFLARSIEIMAECMPMNIRWYLLKSFLNPGESMNEIFQLRTTAGQKEVEVLTEQFPGHLLTILQSNLGLTVAGIPRRLGGRWNQDQFIEEYLQLSFSNNDTAKGSCCEVTGAIDLAPTNHCGDFKVTTKKPLQSGAPAKPLRLQDLQARAQAEIQMTIDKFPEEKKAAYLNALQKAPLVVQKEADPMQFVRRENYDIPAASARLCLYWEERFALFGEDRFCLPLVLSGHGAIEHSETKSLFAGYPALLRDTNDGRKVILFDRRQYVPNVQMDTHLKCLFHLMAWMAEDTKSQKEGILALVFLVTPRMNQIDIDEWKKTLSLMNRAMPVKIKWHLLNWLPKSGNKHYEIQKIMTDGVSLVLNEFATDAAEVHIERQPDQLKSELLELGLTKEGIPFAIGGEWKTDEFAKMAQRRDMEKRKVFATSLSTAQASLAKKGKITESSVRNSGMKRNLPSASIEKDKTSKDDDDKKAKRRLLNLIHSRRKRERRRQEFLDLQEKVSKLMSEEHSLNAENKALEETLSQAESIVERVKAERMA